MAFIAPIDASFLVGETRENPMHIGSLLVFEIPEGAGPDYVAELHRRLLTFDDVRPQFRRRPASANGPLGAMQWRDDEDIDLEYHVRHAALPTPGRVRELLAFVSQQHGNLLDRHRPLWEVHLIEGLEGNRFAIYSKLHHALADGINGTRMTARMFSADPADSDITPIWAVRAPVAKQPKAPRQALNPLNLVRDVLGAGPAVLKATMDGVRNPDVALPFDAPNTILNGPITGARRFAAQSWDFQRMRKAAKNHGATLNDIVLAMCSGALRRYLLEIDALPDKSLVASVPVALETADIERDGNAVTMILARLATDEADPVQRLAKIRASMQAAKDTMKGRTALQISAVGMVTGAGPTMANYVPGWAGSPLPPPYNVVISNVPGPREQLYWNGAKLTGWYPVSIPTVGQALNMTVVSYNDSVEFGLTGARAQLPHMQRMLTYLEDSLAELEAN